MFDNIDNKSYIYDDNKYLYQIQEENYTDTLNHYQLINDNNDKLNIFPIVNDKIFYIQKNIIWSSNINNSKTSKHLELTSIISSHSESRLISMQSNDDEYILCHGDDQNDDNLYIISVNNQQLIIASSFNTQSTFKINLNYRHKNGACIIRNNTLYIISKNRVKSGVNNIHKIKSEIFSHFPSSSLLIIEYIDTKDLTLNHKTINININTFFHIYNVPNSGNNSNNKIYSIHINQSKDVLILDAQYSFKLDSNLNLCQYGLYQNKMISNKNDGLIKLS